VLQGASLSGSRGAVASESKVCSQIGIDLLTRGGNAVDAFIGTQLCVGVIGMYHSGIGGGGFAVVRDRDGTYTVIDYRESAPAAAFEDMYQGNVRGSVFSGLAAGVPGELRGLEEAHRRFAQLPWKDVVHPAANVARHGFVVSEDHVWYMNGAVNTAGWDFLVEDPNFAQDFAPSGKRVVLGETMTRKRYADFLDLVAENGADVFYHGPIAEQTIAAVQADNGTMTLEDLAQYQVIIRPIVNTTYQGYRLFTSGAPTSGAVGLGILKTMEGYPHKDTADRDLTLHRLDEAMRFAYGARQEMGDPAYVDGIDALEEILVSAAGAAATRQLILDNTTQPVENYLTDTRYHHNRPHYTPDSHGTSHIVSADADGMAVSSTTTINTLFGSLVVVPETGVIMNNEMNDFSIPGVRNEFGYAPSPANYIRPGKRPLSSITPIIVEKPDGSLYVAVGAAGGSRILSATAQVTWRVIELGASMLEAIREPRIHDQLMPNVATFESDFDKDLVANMVGKGHDIKWLSNPLSAVQGIRVSGQHFESVGETRQKGSGGLSR
jgi:gamma-glutamyltranspeptidase / glutathione hydrolase